MPALRVAHRIERDGIVAHRVAAHQSEHRTHAPRGGDRLLKEDGLDDPIAAPDSERAEGYAAAAGYEQQPCRLLVGLVAG